MRLYLYIPHTGVSLDRNILEHDIHTYSYLHILHPGVLLDGNILEYAHFKIMHCLKEGRKLDIAVNEVHPRLL